MRDHSLHAGSVQSRAGSSLLISETNHVLISRTAILASTLPEFTEKRAVNEQVNMGENEIYIGIFSTDQLFECVARINRDMETVTF